MHGFVSNVLGDKGSQVYAIAPSVTVRQAVAEMNEKGVGALLVVDRDEQPLGIFSERDVLRRVVGEGRDPLHTRVADVMTHDLIVVSPSTTVSEAMAVMTQSRCRHLPVMDSGRLAGMVSIGDLTRWVSLTQEVEIQHLVDYITGRHPA
ncbi:MAG: CBS domain-containing protein [Chloroflexi bacterium]|nr:CBS domain-containing protein [Chloroflexota bacterium]